MSTSDLRNTWLALWGRLGVNGDPFPVYEDLLSRYAEPERAYHNLSHIEQCLTEFGEFSEPASNRDAIEFALWFHDAVYDTRAKDNEERSASLAREVAASLPDSFGDLTTRLILATKHSALPNTVDEQIIVDIDLSILGQNRTRFDEYERQIRAEYSWVPADAFAQGRSAILSTFLARARIYSTEILRGKYETCARENLTRSIARLGS
jgi:predicted metal-dependent HD superfamily phosphohydrolase